MQRGGATDRKKRHETMQDWEITKVGAAILRILDGLRHAKEFVYFNDIMKRIAYPTLHVKNELKKLERKKFVRIRKEEKGIAVKITEKGRFALSLWDFKRHDIVDKVLRVIGEGKEAWILLALDPEGQPLALKVHKYSPEEFAKFKRSFTWAAAQFWEEKLDYRFLSIDIPRLKAKVEYEMLKILYSKGFPVPKPISINRHVVAMEFLGVNYVPYPLLYRCEIEDPKSYLEDILDTYERIVRDAKIVHGDLSEFNIMVDPEGQFYFIDWPQAVFTTAVFWKKMYQRDVENIKKYFERKYGVCLEGGSKENSTS